MPIIGIYGGISQGKTAVMTSILLREHRRYNRPLVTNYHLKQVPFSYITFENMLAMAQADLDLTNVAFGLDEIHIWMDSRTSNKKENRLFSYWVNQTGKDDINLYYTTQSKNLVDLRLRQRTDIWIYVKKQGDLHLCAIEDLTQPELGIQKMAIRGEHVYQFYDTREKVKPRKADA